MQEGLSAPVPFENPHICPTHTISRPMEVCMRKQRWGNRDIQHGQPQLRSSWHFLPSPSSPALERLGSWRESHSCH